jgi:mitochondrial fission protein ELM1
MTRKSIIWQISDGKRGHENQSRGLIDAIVRIQPAEVVTLKIETCQASWPQALLGKFPPADSLPKPDLIIGTGSHTHSTILAAGRASGAPTVVLMTPWFGILPQFDLCITPEHDGKSAANLICTKGALNIVRPSTTQADNRGLILIGGPSTHHNWDDAQLQTQLQCILESNIEIQWRLTTSRRTTKTTTTALLNMANQQLQVVPLEETTPDWLPEQLSLASCTWVTEDSVSMVYEALTSGARVGILPAPRKNSSSRVIHGLEKLISDQRATAFNSKQANLLIHAKPTPLNEADRIAKIVAEKFLK